MTNSQLCLICSAIYGASGTKAGIFVAFMFAAAALVSALQEMMQRRATPEGKSE